MSGGCVSLVFLLVLIHLLKTYRGVTVNVGIGPDGEGVYVSFENVERCMAFSL